MEIDAESSVAMWLTASVKAIITQYRVSRDKERVIKTPKQIYFLVPAGTGKSSSTLNMTLVLQFCAARETFLMISSGSLKVLVAWVWWRLPC